MTAEKRAFVLTDLTSLVNRHSLENESNTPDFILAEYLCDCIDAHTQAVRRRDNWYGGKQSIMDSEKKEKWETKSA